MKNSGVISVVGLVCFLMVAGGTTHAADGKKCDAAAKAEVNRLGDELRKGLQKGNYQQAARGYESMVGTTCALAEAHHSLGAQAYYGLGNITSGVAAQRNGGAEESKQATETLKSYGSVKIKNRGKSKRELKKTDDAPFDPTQRKAIEFAQSKVQADGEFEGYLPEGKYEISGDAFQVEAGKEVSVKK